MTEPIIRVENLGKWYRIGAREKLPTSPISALKRASGAPFKYLSSVLRQPAPEEIIWALKDVSFEVQPGEVIGIIGRNGAGKSTLLKILSRITKPTTGYAEINGRVASLLEVGTGFHPELTGRENVYLNGTVLGMTKREIDKKFDEIVNFSGVEKFIDTPVKRYSSGMQVRLAFAVAAHLEPEILIIDEVLAVGDAAFQKKCLGKMKHVSSSEGRTVLFVSHNTSAVQNLCSSAILLKQGQLVTRDEVNKVLDQYLLTDVEIKSTYSIPLPENEQTAAYANKVSIEDRLGNPLFSIPVGSRWQIKVEFSVKKSIDDLVVAVGFVTTDNVPLRTCWSKPFSVTPGKYQTIFSEDLLILGPGIYSLIVGLSTSDGENLQYTPNAALLEIAEIEKLESEDFNLAKISGTGIILNPMSITSKKLILS